MAKLVCVYGSNKDDQFPIEEGVTTIGRTAECDIALFDRQCSRRHCQIFRKGKHFTIEDLESRHGTLLNHKPVERRRPLTFEDKIQIGKTVLVLSSKSLGDALDEAAGDMASELEGEGFDRAIDSAAVDVLKTQIPGKGKKKGGGLLGSIFGDKK